MPLAPDFSFSDIRDFDADKYFWPKVNISTVSECWEWQSGRMTRGYGVVYTNGKRRLAHRVSFAILTRETIPAGTLLDHEECSNPPCVNPYHLRITDTPRNTRRVTRTRSSNRSGISGVWWLSARGKWGSQLRTSSGRIDLGEFSSLYEAHLAYIQAYSQYGEVGPRELSSEELEWAERVRVWESLNGPMRMSDVEALR